MSSKGGHATIRAMNKELAAVRALLSARAHLETVTPLQRDCGGLCLSACCQTPEGGLGGMLLFPGEETLYQILPAAFSLQANDHILPGGVLLVCEGRCARHDRPLACRIFPLQFGFAEGEATVFLDPRAWPVCPLMPSGMEGLRADFVGAAKQAAEVLCLVPILREFIESQQTHIQGYTKPLWESGEWA